MPGYNHYPWCKCGWCFKSRNHDLNNKLSKFTEAIHVQKNQEVKTSLISCWWCNDSVFYHTNGNGDSVLFDSLGWPWEVHECWIKYSNGLKNKNGILFKKTSNLWPEASINFNNENEEFYFSKQIQHKILIGLAKQTGEKKISKFSIFGLNEKNLSSHMKLSVEDLRRIYGCFYVRYESNLISIKTIEFLNNPELIKSKNLLQKRYLILSVLKIFSEVRLSKYLDKYVIYNLNEEMLAQSFGLSIGELRSQFKQVYTSFPGKILISREQLGNSEKTDQTKSSTTNETERKTKNLINKRKKKRKSRLGSKPISAFLNLCPYCQLYSSNNKTKLLQHIKRQHKGGNVAIIR